MVGKTGILPLSIKLRLKSDKSKSKRKTCINEFKNMNIKRYQNNLPESSMKYNTKSYSGFQSSKSFMSSKRKKLSRKKSKTKGLCEDCRNSTAKEEKDRNEEKNRHQE